MTKNEIKDLITKSKLLEDDATTTTDLGGSAGGMDTVADTAADTLGTQQAANNSTDTTSSDYTNDDVLFGSDPLGGDSQFGSVGGGIGDMGDAGASQPTISPDAPRYKILNAIIPQETTDETTEDDNASIYFRIQNMKDGKLSVVKLQDIDFQ